MLSEYKPRQAWTSFSSSTQDLNRARATYKLVKTLAKAQLGLAWSQTHKDVGSNQNYGYSYYVRIKKYTS